MISRDLANQVQSKLRQWDKESAMHFCRLAQIHGSRFENLVYPTGLKMVRVSNPTLAEAAEVQLSVAKQLRRDGFRVIS